MDTPPHIVLATRNQGKVKELRLALADWPGRVLTVADFPDAPEVVEDAPTLEGNAEKKARALYTHTGFPALADDTGLEVTALDGRPGVYSARYAGPAEDAVANRALLRQELVGHPNRSAQFRTVIAFVQADQVHFFEGRCTGTILPEERGTGGFGYDPLFLPDGHDQTFAELSLAAKNAISHRGKALAQFVQFLQALSS